MPSISTLFCASLLASAAFASTACDLPPVPTPKQRLPTTSALFPPLTYAAGQISSGVAGNAQAQAAAVCTHPFVNVDLKTVSQSDLKNLEAFRLAAELIEGSTFNPRVAAAKGAEKIALQNGKIKNKVLKLTCLGQVDRIKQAQGTDETAASIDIAKKLAHNVALDVAARGQASTSVV